jgi:hypothetical protein
LAGQLITGASASWTDTLNEQLADPALLTAVQVTVVAPNEKTAGEVMTVPEPVLQVTVGAGLPVTVGENETLVLHCPGVFGSTMSAGQEMVGGVPAVLRLTVTEKLHCAVLPAASVAVQLTGVIPTPKDVPEAGVQAVVTPGQLSVAVGAA